MSSARIFFAAFVLGVTVAGSIWLAMYHVVLRLADRKNGTDPLEPTQFTQAPAPVWWGAWAAIALLLVGVAIVARVERGQLNVFRELGKRLAASKP